MKKRLFYWLKKKAHRPLIELDDYASQIEAGVKATISNLVPGSVLVASDHFSFEVYIEPENWQLRKMGEQISFIEDEIRKFVTVYGKSRQLFVRMTDKEVNELKK